MKILINDPIVSRSWSFRRGDVIDTKTSEVITEEQALLWLNAGIAEAVKEPAKKRATKQEVS